MAIRITIFLASFLAAGFLAVLVGPSRLRTGTFALADDATTQPKSAGSLRRSHIQSAGEVAALSTETKTAFVGDGLLTSRASEVLRSQLGLERGSGLVVESVNPGTAAAKAGFKRNDVIVSIDDQLLLLPEQLIALLEAADSAPLECRVVRGGQTIKVPLRSNAQPTGASTADSLPSTPEPEKAARIAPTQTVETTPAQKTATTHRSPPKASVGKSRFTSGLVRQFSNDTLIQQDADYQIKVTRGSETQLVVQDNRGRVVFNNTIDTPEQRSLMPTPVRSRVEHLERLLAHMAQHDSAKECPECQQTSAATRPEPTHPSPETSSTKPAFEIGSLEIAPIQLR